MRKDTLRVGALLLLAVAMASGCARDYGYVSVARAGMEVRLRSDWSSLWAERAKITPEQGKVAIPAGTYRPEMIHLVAEQGAQPGQQGTATWTLTSLGPFGKLQRVQVRESQTTSLEAGLPLLVKVRTRRWGRTVRVDFQITGQAGEVYERAARRNGRRQPAPNVKIVDASGKVLQTGRFEYG